MFDVIFVTHKSMLAIPTPTVWTPSWYSKQGRIQPGQFLESFMVNRVVTTRLAYGPVIWLGLRKPRKKQKVQDILILKEKERKRAPRRSLEW